ncbi:MAG TPA: Gfo/Idh/MocA family oxidoreductase [Aggregatilineales bacterium]|nr:Gfo/Idh/MocA family oxidoreductase [Anaerolineales bacterium]HRE49197.1 Gfo/Idh/MocA family oxidoreductase [Aggregatilineales bacterium]
MVTIGVIGTGNVSAQYFKGVREFAGITIGACADSDQARAQHAAAEWSVPRALTVDELLADSGIDIVLNLTIPDVHAEISLRAIQAGKHVYSEKPLAVSLSDAHAVLKAAAERGLRVGCAPDTFLFAEHQTGRKLLDEGVIGDPVAAAGFFMGRGPEGWHPNPAFFYQPGAGPLFDVGVYWVTCFVTLLGAVRTVTAAARASFPERIAGDGRRIPVNVDTHISASLECESGAIATLISSFDVQGHRLPRLELYGAKGTLALPDPNGFDPSVRLYIPNGAEWVEQDQPYNRAWRRGVGLADMANAIHEGRPHRASGELALHVLEVMHGIIEAAHSGKRVSIESRPERPPLLPLPVPAW